MVKKLDGTFYFSNSSLVFWVTQKDKKVLEAIAQFLKNIPLSPHKILLNLINLIVLLKTIQILLN